MSTDSTELTFVRCPSCRSLVPASQTRCRMCGASLDASGKVEEGDKGVDAKAPRVKQRTMSQPKGELAAALGQIREENTGASAPKVAAPVAPSAAEDDYEREDLPADDPLSAYIEEVDSTPSAEPQDDFDQLVEGSEAISSVASASNGVELHVEAEPEIVVPEPAAKVELPRQEPRVVVESGRRPASSGLSFSKGRQEQRVEAKTERAPEPKIDHAVAKAPTPSIEAPQPAKHTHKDAQPQQQRTSAPPKITKPGVKGRLFGWLVNYADPDGSAIELREGRFFISGSSLKPNDLVLDDPSVSTPHAMVSIALDGGLQMQDLMSDRGLFVRRRNGDTYNREEQVQIEHGDWLRIGDLEFLVSLIAHVGIK